MPIHFCCLYTVMETFITSLFAPPLPLILLSALLYFSIFFSRFRRPCKHSSPCHGPKSYPLIGCLVSFYKNRHRLLDWYTDLLAQSPSATIVLHRPGAPRTIVTANPDNVEYVLKTNFNNFPKGRPFTEILGDFLGCGIFNVDGELWRAQRKLASHEFTTVSLQEFVMETLRDEVDDRLLPVLESLADLEVEVDLQDLLRRLAFNMICKVSLGVDRFSLDPSRPASPIARAFDVASAVSARRGAAPLFLIWKVKRWLRVGSERKLREAVGEVHEYVTEMIRNKKKAMDEKEDLDHDLDLLSRLISAGHEEEVIRDAVISFIMAGRDTTSAAMTWLFWLLSYHPNIRRELVKEIERVRETEKSDCESLEEMRLLKACLCECMRLYPPVVWDSKHTFVDDLLPDGTPVQAGDRVTYFPYGMGRMEGLWGKDRFEFKPDRWFAEPDTARAALKNVCPYKFPVFQAGPRVCLGKQMAFYQMTYVMASVLRRFEIVPVESGEPVFVPLLTAHMAGGFKVNIRRRKIDS